MNASFARFTSWTVHDITRMEREMLECLRWDVYVSAEESVHSTRQELPPHPTDCSQTLSRLALRLLHRASGFYSAHLATAARLSGTDDGTPDPGAALLGNLFLMQPRPGVEERSWKHGLVKAPGEGGSRIPTSPDMPTVYLDASPGLPPGRASRVRMASEPAPSVGIGLGGGRQPTKGGGQTVWRKGRLERRSSAGDEQSHSQDVDTALTNKIGRRSVLLERSETQTPSQ